MRVSAAVEDGTAGSKGRLPVLQLVAGLKGLFCFLKFCIYFVKETRNTSLSSKKKKRSRLRKIRIIKTSILILNKI